MVTYVWINKIDYEAVHALIQIYMDDELIMEYEIDPQKVEQDLPQITDYDIRYFKGYETVTVRAGTFVNCLKIEVEEEDVISRVWAHESVPIFGIVKFEVIENGTLVSLMELISYGG